MVNFRWMGVAAAALGLACGPSTRPGEDGLDTEGDDGGSTASAATDTAAGACDPPDDAIHARMITGRGTPTIEVLTDASDDPEPISCASSIPSCHYHVHRLVPIGTFQAGTFTVEDGTLSHEVESCSCCNGEGGESDETRETREFSTGHLELEVAREGCIFGTFLASGGERIAFQAERCAQ